MNENLIELLSVRGMLAGVASEAGVSYQAVVKWRDKGSLPRTEHLPKSHPDKTDYAEAVVRAAKSRGVKLNDKPVKKSDLL